MNFSAQVILSVGCLRQSTFVKTPVGKAGAHSERRLVIGFAIAALMAR